MDNISEYANTIPGESLQSVRMTGGLPGLTTWLTPLKNTLLHAANLRTFHYKEHGIGTNFEFEDGERLPPIKNLLLKSYYWTHDAEQVRKHWNFSQMRSLRLTSVPMSAFLSSINMEDFANLHTLQLEDRHVYTDEDSVDTLS